MLTLQSHIVNLYLLAAVMSVDATTVIANVVKPCCESTIFLADECIFSQKLSNAKIHKNDQVSINNFVFFQER